MAPIRVLVADDHAVVRQGLRTFLELQDDIEVVADVADGQQALDAVADHDPDVVLMDLVLPVVDGVEAIRRIAGEHPRTRVIALTSFLDDDKVFSAVRKDVQPQELVNAIRTVHGGGALLHPAVAARLMEEFAGSGEDRSEQLTAREREVVELIARGWSNKRIALELGISERTVKAHVRNILVKLDLTDRTQVAVHAVREGWVRGE